MYLSLGKPTWSLYFSKRTTASVSFKKPSCKLKAILNNRIRKGRDSAESAEFKSLQDVSNLKYEADPWFWQFSIIAFLDRWSKRTVG